MPDQDTTSSQVAHNARRVHKVSFMCCFFVLTAYKKAGVLWLCPQTPWQGEVPVVVPVALDPANARHRNFGG